MDSLATSAKKEEQAADLSLQFQSDLRHSLTVNGINNRMISHLSQMVCILNKRYFLKCLVENKSLLKLDLIREFEELVVWGHRRSSTTSSAGPLSSTRSSARRSSPSSTPAPSCSFRP